MDWTGLEWTGLDLSGVEWSGVDWTGVHSSLVDSLPKYMIFGSSPVESIWTGGGTEKYWLFY